MSTRILEWLNVKTHSYKAICQHVFWSGWNAITWSRFLTASVEKHWPPHSHAFLCWGLNGRREGSVMPPSPGTYWVGGCEVPQVGRNATAKRTCRCTSSVVQCNILTRWMVRGSISSRDRMPFSSPKPAVWLWDPLSRQFSGYSVLVSRA